MSLTDDMKALAPFTYTEEAGEAIRKFNSSTTGKKRGKIPTVEETFCTLVLVGGKFVQRETFEKIDAIRKYVRHILCDEILIGSPSII